MKKSLTVFLFGLSLLFFFHCKTTNLMDYTYVDQAGNRYYIKAQTIRYSPMTKEHSSSGEYDGGEPKTVEISKNQRKDLNEVFEKIIANPKGRTDTRTMGSCTIFQKGADKTNTYMFRYNSAPQKEINAKLKALLDG